MLKLRFPSVDLNYWIYR